MKVTLCDACLVEGKMVPGEWRFRFKKEFTSFGLECCTAHRPTVKTLSYDVGLKMLHDVNTNVQRLREEANA